jgi:RNA polymerase sigma-70 factor (ECF subfamily)
MKITDKISETELMSSLASGEMEALAEIVKRHQDKVLALAYRFLNDWTKAEDVAQEAFLRIHRSAANYKPQASFSTWLYRIVANLCLDERRRQTRLPLSIEDSPCDVADDSGSDAVERNETIELVQKAISELPERQRLAVILHRYENLSYDQICEVTQWTKSAVESLLVRAYANLREKLSKIEKFTE